MKITVQKYSVVSISLLCALFVIYSLSRVFSGDWILPQAFTVGPLSLHYYGITMALAVGAGWWLALRRASKYGFTSSQADILFQWLVVVGFVGARLYHVASSWQYYWQYPLDILKVWHGGLSIFGALIGGFLVVVIFVMKNKQRDSNAVSAVIPSESSSRGVSITKAVDSSTPKASPGMTMRGEGNVQNFAFNILHLLDWLIPSVVLGQVIGRFGNFFNYEAFGYPTDLPWKMFVPMQFRPVELVQYAFFHPLFLYEAVGNVLILVALIGYAKGKQWPAGRLFFLYLFLYNTLRFALEFLRVDSTFLWSFIRLNTLASAVLCLVGIAGIVLQSAYANKSNNYAK